MPQHKFNKLSKDYRRFQRFINLSGKLVKSLLITVVLQIASANSKTVTSLNFLKLTSSTVALNSSQLAPVS